jgi:hypothetical protein
MTMKRLIPSGLIVILCMALGLPSWAQTQEEMEEYAACDKTVAILKGKTVTMDFKDAPIGAVIRFMAESTGVNMVLDPAVLEAFANEGKTVIMRLDKLAALDALHVILRFNGLAWTWRNGVVFITTPDRMVGKPYVRLHEVRGILGPILDRPGSVRDLFRAYEGDQGGRESEALESVHPMVLEDLVCMIRESIATDTWESGLYGISVSGGNLVVNHERKVHEAIHDLLRSIEACTSPSIGIRARILDVGPEALDALGPGLLVSDAQALALEAAAAKRPQPFPECRLVAVNGQRNHFTGGRDFVFLAGNSGGEPSTRSARDGVVLDVQPLFTRGKGVPALVRLFASTGDTSTERLARMPFLQVGTAVVIPRTGWLLLAAGAIRPAADGRRSDGVIVVLLAADVGIWPEPESFEEKTDPPVPPVRALLAERLSVEYMDVPLKDVVGDIARKIGGNIVIDTRVGESKSEDELLVQVSVKDLPAVEILNLILGMKGLGFVIENGVILVTTAEGAWTAASLRIVPIHDLVSPMPRFDAEWRGFPSGDPLPETEEYVDQGTSGDDLLCMLKERIAPETWDTPPNQIFHRQQHFFVRNQRQILAKVETLIESLRQARWRRVLVEGRFLAAPAGWAEGMGIRGSVLTQAQCEAVEKALQSEGALLRDRFRVHGRVGLRFCASGGRQIVFATGSGDKGAFDTKAALDGWWARMEAVPGIDEGRMTLAIDARASVYTPPEEPLEESGDMASSEYKADLRLEDGGGALLGGVGPRDGQGASWLLYVRARFVKE